MKALTKISYLLFVICMIVLPVSCNKSKLPVGENRLAVPGGNIWYKISGDGNGIPVVLLHGGPGSSSYYLKPFEDLGNDRQVIRYDQLGAGKSDAISDTALFTINHFVNELELLRKQLKIKKWHLFGHSWGTILAMEYYKKYPENVSSIIFGSAALNVKMWVQHARQLLKTLPDSLQQAILKAESSGNIKDPLYNMANEKFFSMYVVRKPVSTDMDSMFSTMNNKIYMYMQGPSEFIITGTLKDYDATPFLSGIKVPALFTVGEFDEAGIENIKSFAKQVPDSKFYILKGAAHMTSWDARDENVKIVRDFLNSVDSRNKK